MMLRDCRDDKVQEAGIEVRTGRKWSAAEAVEVAEARLRHKDIVGMVTSGRQGLGMVNRTSWRTAGIKERRSLVQKEVRDSEEESRHAKAAGMRKQGSWLLWEGVRQKKLSWNDVRAMEEHRLRFFSEISI